MSAPPTPDEVASWAKRDRANYAKATTDEQRIRVRTQREARLARERAREKRNRTAKKAVAATTRSSSLERASPPPGLTGKEAARWRYNQKNKEIKKRQAEIARNDEIAGVDGSITGLTMDADSDEGDSDGRADEEIDEPVFSQNPKALAVVFDDLSDSDEKSEDLEFRLLAGLQTDDTAAEDSMPAANRAFAEERDQSKSSDDEFEDDLGLKRKSSIDAGQQKITADIPAVEKSKVDVSPVEQALPRGGTPAASFSEKTIGNEFAETKRIAEIIFGQRASIEDPERPAEPRAVRTTSAPIKGNEAANARATSADVFSTTRKKKDASWYQPFNRTIPQSGDANHGRFVELLTFASDHISTTQYRDLNRGDEQESFPSPITNGKSSKETYKHTGYRYEGEVKIRKTAAEKAMAYFQAIDRAHPDGKKPRRYVLNEGEPCGSVLEGVRWADKLKTLNDHLLLKKFESHATIVVDCKGSSYVANGQYKYWYTSLREMMAKYPSQISVQIRDASILTAGRTPYLLTKTMADITREAEQKYTVQYFTERVGYKSFDDPSGERYLKLYNDAIHNDWKAQEERKKDIVENFNNVVMFIEHAKVANPWCNLAMPPTSFVPAAQAQSGVGAGPSDTCERPGSPKRKHEDNMEGSSADMFPNKRSCTGGV